MTLSLNVPQTTHTDFTPRITVIGVGGGGTNAVDNMIAMNLRGVEFVVANTDAQQLMHSKADRRVQLGPHLTQGLGAGAKPDVGRAAAEEAADELYRHLDGTHMVFITAGMGGGTGTGAAPVVARMAKEKGILTVGVVTRPFGFEGARRARSADEGILELQQYVDTLIVIPNQNLFHMANERTTWKEAFKMADQVLYMGVRGVTDLMMVHGQINLDFNDIKTVMAEMGKAMMGTGEAEGEDRARRAAEAAINNPLLEETSMAGARGLLINITGGEDLTLFEVDQAVSTVREQVDDEANVLFGSATDESLNGRIRVSVVATGIDSPASREMPKPLKLVANGGVAAVASQIIETQPVSMARTTVQVQMAEPVMAQAQAAASNVTALRYPSAQPAMQAQPEARVVMPDPMPAEDEQVAAHKAVRDAMQARASTTQAPQARQRPASNLFANVQMAAPAPAEAPAAGQPRSLFQQATGLFRKRAAAPVQEAPVQQPVRRREPASAPVHAEQHAEPEYEAERRGHGIDDSGLDIPAFLRRQS